MQLINIMLRRRVFALATLLVALGFGVAPVTVEAQEGAGRITQMKGRAMAASPDGDIRRVRRGSVVRPGDTINTERGSFAKIKFSDGGAVFLRPSTRFKLQEYESKGGEDDRSLMRLFKGGLRFVTGLIGKKNRNRWKLFTPSATIGIRGTDGAVQIDGARTFLLVFDGEITLADSTGAEGTFLANQAAFVSDVEPPTPIDPGDTPIDPLNFPSPLDEQPAADCAG